MRVSSSTLLSPVWASGFPSGTLKSRRMKTRLPEISRSRMERILVIMGSGSLASHVERQVDHASRKTGLVVVPREDLHEVPLEHARDRKIDRRAVLAPVVVDRDELSGRNAQDALHRSLGCLPESAVDFVLRRRLLE